MGKKIDEYRPGSGRRLREDDSVINVADLVEDIKDELEEANTTLAQIRDGGGGGGGGSSITRQSMGSPVAAADCILIQLEAMHNGSYTLATQLDVCRTLILARLVNGDPDTPGTVTINGTDINDAAISEVMIPGNHEVFVSSTKAFKTVTSVVGAGWTANGDADQLYLAAGPGLGLDSIPASADAVLFGTMGGFIAPAPSVTIGATVAECFVTLGSDMSGQACYLFIQG